MKYNQPKTEVTNLKTASLFRLETHQATRKCMRLPAETSFPNAPAYVRTNLISRV